MRRILALAVLAATMPVSAQAPGGQVVLPAAPGFVIANQQRLGRQILVEMVPAGESVQRYTKIITLTSSPGLGRIGVPEYLMEFTRRYRAHCPRSTSGAVPMGRAPGIRIDCRLNPETGKGETLFLRAFPVGQDMATAQVTFVGNLVAPRDAQWARDYLGRVG